MISVKGLTKSFDGRMVLDHINLEVKTGELLVILGESGTGKSVLLKNMMGLIVPDEGAVIIDGVDITKLREKDLLKVRQKIGYLFQEGALYDFMTVYENLAFPLREHTTLNEKAIKAKIKVFLAIVDLKDVEDKYPAELSGGMKKRVGLARAIIMDSKILLCDEPTSGLDPIRSRDISDLIRNVSKTLNCTTVITSHDLTNSFRIADRVAILKDGKIIAQGTQKDIEASPQAFVQEFINN